MSAEHWQLLVRLLVALVFTAAVVAKLRDRAAFRVALEDFGVLPRHWSGPAAAAVMTAEGATAAALFAGGPLLVPAFVVAACLLTAFLVALVVALRRRRVVNCNCFGAASTRISGYDVARNLVLIAGCAVGIATDPGADSAPAAEVALLGLAAAGLAVVLVNLGDVLRTVRRPFWVPP